MRHRSTQSSGSGFHWMEGSLLGDSGAASGSSSNNNNSVSSLARLLDGWRIYDIRREFGRQGISSAGMQARRLSLGTAWRLSDVNACYGLCDTYPDTLAVPASVDDTTLRSCASYRIKVRCCSWLCVYA